jgi:hypothetical protein
MQVSKEERGKEYMINMVKEHSVAQSLLLQDLKGYQSSHHLNNNDNQKQAI